MAQGESWACCADCARVFAWQRGGSIALKQLAPALVGRRWRHRQCRVGTSPRVCGCPGSPCRCS